MSICHLFPLLCLLLLFSRAYTLFGYGLLRYHFTSYDDAVYLEQIYFNKMFMIQYNSTLGNFTGYTKKAKEIADDLNKNPAFLRKQKQKEENYKYFIQWAFNALSKPVKPSVKLRSVKAVGSKHPGMLMCSAYNFWPKQIRVTWLRNGKAVTSDVSSTEELPDGNWLYQMHSYLEYTPRSGEKITCMLEHASLMEPKLYEWEPTQRDSERNKIAAGTGGLLLGLVFLGAGLIYYKKKTTGLELVPTS